MKRKDVLSKLLQINKRMIKTKKKLNLKIKISLKKEAGITIREEMSLSREL